MQIFAKQGGMVVCSLARGGRGYGYELWVDAGGSDNAIDLRDCRPRLGVKRAQLLSCTCCELVGLLPCRVGGRYKR